MRCVHEAQLHDENSFITLTYSDEHLPDDYSVSVRDLQLFMKRMRKRFGRMRFLACGEYGERTLRPHYHAILFGFQFPDLQPYKVNHNADVLYTSAALSDTWGQGLATVGAVSFESAGYVARYSLKKITGRQAREHYTRTHPLTGETVQVRPEFLTMSRRPGIGAAWWDRYASDVYPSDHVVIRGVRMKPPRFYDQRLAQEDLDDLKHERVQRARQHADNNTPERLAVREELQRIRLEQLKRTTE